MAYSCHRYFAGKCHVQSHIQPKLIYQQLINKVWQLDSRDVDRLARWIRCLLSLAFSSNAAMAENIVDQVISIAENAKAVCLAKRFHASAVTFHRH